MSRKEKAQAEAVQTLKEWGVKDGTLVSARVTKVSRSGMFRRVKLNIVSENDPRTSEIIDITYWAAQALGWSYKDGYDGGIGVSGCGMDMLFATVDALSYAMGYGAMNQSRDHIEGKTTGLRYKSL